MNVMKLSLDRENILEFNVDIQGYANTSTTKPPKVRMILEQNELGFCVDATKEGKTYSVIIPEMKNVMESGLCDVRMEVIIDNKYFVPWESQIEFNKEVQVSAAPILKNDPETEEAKKTIDDISKKNENKKVKNLDKDLSRADVFDRTIADIMEHDRVTNNIMSNLTISNKEKTLIKSKKKDVQQPIADIKPNGNIKKENIDVDKTVDDIIKISKPLSIKTAPVIKNKPQSELQQPVVKEEKAQPELQQPVVKEVKEKKAQPVVKEEKASIKSNKKESFQLIVDMKPNGNIKKEIINIDNIVDDLNLLAKKVH